MECRFCGASNAEDAAVCRGCGAVLGETGAPVPEKKTSGLAIASFILALLCLTCIAWPLLFVPAIILGVLALVKIGGHQERLKGKGLAIAGIVIPSVMLILLPVIAMLLAILMPALNKTREIAQRTVCQTNLKGLRNAIVVYSNDYDGRVPTPTQWTDLLMEYADVSSQSLSCPSADQIDTDYAYAMNEHLTGRILDEVPPNTVLLFETQLGPNAAGGPEDAVMRHEAAGQRGANILFADGHVELVREDSIGQLLWNPEEN